VPLDRIAPLAAVPAIAPRPILFIHGEADRRIPADHTRRLVSASKSPDTEVWYVPGATHAQAFNTDRAGFLARVFAFFDRHLVSAASPPDRKASGPVHGRLETGALNP